MINKHESDTYINEFKLAVNDQRNQGLVKEVNLQLVLSFEDYLKPLLKADIDTLVLGCTHYPLFKELLSELAGPKIQIIDSATAVADAVEKELIAHKLTNQSGSPATKRIFATDWGQRFEQVGSRFLGTSLPEVEHVDL